MGLLPHWAIRPNTSLPSSILRRRRRHHLLLQLAEKKRAFVWPPARGALGSLESASESSLGSGAPARTTHPLPPLLSGLPLSLPLSTHGSTSLRRRLVASFHLLYVPTFVSSFDFCSFLQIRGLVGWPVNLSRSLLLLPDASCKIRDEARIDLQPITPDLAKARCGLATASAEYNQTARRFQTWSPAKMIFFSSSF